MTIATGLVLLCSALVAAISGVLFLIFAQRPRPAQYHNLFATTSDHVVFLFDGEVLVDATPPARTLLAQSPVLGGDWLRMMAKLGPRFPQLEQRILTLGYNGTFLLPSVEGNLAPQLLKGEMVGGLTRLTLIYPETTIGEKGGNAAIFQATMEELEDLRRVIANSPILIWEENETGEVTWANTLYVQRAIERLEAGQDVSWPLPRIFDRIASKQVAAGQRHRVDMPDGKITWYDLTTVPLPSGRMIYAIPADATVVAETSLREFMQTLTKTFAHLPIGLAIFDRNRQLQLFNPALLDLTGLPAEFLSTRPSMMSMLDAMRERAMLPEPKDYRTWRKTMVELEEAAASGAYEETWSLPGGQTYHVIGRPHPNGALALMFKDISNEMSRTRRYRADLELGQAAMDVLEEGIAVFSSTGALAMTNTAYARIWGHDPAELLSEAGVRTLVHWWRDHTASSILWDDVESYVAQMGDRDPWVGDARLLDGRMMECRFAPITGGGTAITFRVAITDAEKLRFVSTRDRLTA